MENSAQRKIFEIQQCFDLNYELKKIAVFFQCSAEEIEIEICNVHTYIDNINGEKTKIPQEESKSFFLKDYENESFNITQSYDFIAWKRVNEHRFWLELDSKNSKLFLICKNEDYSSLFDNLQETHRQINMQKALLGVIFRDFSKQCEEDLLDSKLKNAKDWIGGIKKITLEQSKVYSPSSDSYFFFTLEKEWENKNKESLENSSYAIQEGREAGRLFKAREGNDGRNLLGNFIKNERTEVSSIEFGSLEGDFLIEEDEECLIYKALKSGFVGLNGSGLILIKDFNFEEINHRNIGNLLGGIENGFELNIKASSAEKDAIGSGLVIEARKLIVNGGVDQGVILRTTECFINGLTHQGSEIYANHAQISTHKGYLKTIQAEIKVCESGIVECMDGKFEDLVGSEIFCKNAQIQNLRSNNKISFCGKLEIQNNLGGKNEFRIESSAFCEYRDKIKEIQQKHQRYTELINKTLKSYNIEAQKIAQMKPAVQQFESIFLENTQRGLQTQPYITDTIEQYTTMNKTLKEAKEKILLHQARANEIKQELEPFAQLCIDAKLICHSPWVEQNQVEFFDLYHGTRESLMIEEGEKVHIIIDPRTQKLTKERDL